MEVCQTVEDCSCGAAKSYSELAKTRKGVADSHGLNESYRAVHGQCIPFNPSAKSIRKIYSLLNHEEKQQGIITRQALIEPIAMTVQYLRNNGK